MPEENYIYYGDSAHAPYGTRSVENIQELSEACVQFLLDKGAKAIVIACNTATSAAAGLLREKYPDMPIIGIEPALKPAVLWKEHDRDCSYGNSYDAAAGKISESAAHLRR